MDLLAKADANLEVAWINAELAERKAREATGGAAGAGADADAARRAKRLNGARPAVGGRTASSRLVAPRAPVPRTCTRRALCGGLASSGARMAAPPFACSTQDHAHIALAMSSALECGTHQPTRHACCWQLHLLIGGPTGAHGRSRGRRRRGRGGARGGALRGGARQEEAEGAPLASRAPQPSCPARPSRPLLHPTPKWSSRRKPFAHNFPTPPPSVSNQNAIPHVHPA
jgi:hypothetical protein